MSKEIKEAFSPPAATTAWCEVPGRVGSMFRLFESVSSRIPFDVHDERLKSVCKGLEDRAGASHSLGLRRRDSLLSAWALALKVRALEEPCSSPSLFIHSHLACYNDFIPRFSLWETNKRRPISRGKWDVNWEASVPLGESSLLLSLCSSEMRLLDWPATLVNCSPISNSARLEGEINSL